MNLLNSFAQGLVNTAVQEGRKVAAEKQHEIDNLTNELAVARIKANTPAPYVSTGPSSYQFNELQEKIEQIAREKKETENLLRDWMVSAEVFKRIAEKYGSALNVSDESFKNEMVETSKVVYTEFDEADKLKEAEELARYQKYFDSLPPERRIEIEETRIRVKERAEKLRLAKE